MGFRVEFLLLTSASIDHHTLVMIACNQKSLVIVAELQTPSYKRNGINFVVLSAFIQGDDSQGPNGIVIAFARQNP